MIHIKDFIAVYTPGLISKGDIYPWKLIEALPDLLHSLIPQLDSEYQVSDGIAIHKTAVIEAHSVIKAPSIIGPHCFIAAHAYLRGGVFLDESVNVGPGTEIKNSILFAHSALAHFNFVGDSIIGSRVNFEAGSVIANHFNERTDKTIWIKSGNELINTGVKKFGALIGDDCRIGANAVLSPGTLLDKGTVVRRLELVEQVSEQNIKHQ